MTGQRNIIEVIRDCLRIMEDSDRLYKQGKLNENEFLAIERTVQEHLDEILRAMYPRAIESA